MGREGLGGESEERSIGLAEVVPLVREEVEVEEDENQEADVDVVEGRDGAISMKQTSGHSGGARSISEQDSYFVRCEVIH